MPFALVFRDAGLLGHIRKTSVAQIAIQPVLRPLEQPRVAVDADAAPGIAAEGVELGSPPDVVDDEEIEKTIVIEIEPGCSDGPFAAVDIRLGRDILESAVAAIAVEDVVGERRSTKRSG